MGQIAFNVMEMTGWTWVDLAAVTIDVVQDNSLQGNHIVYIVNSLPPVLIV
jgi:hypothetical protein